MLKRHPHTPAHLFVNNTLYFITGAIYQKRRLLTTELKQQLLSIIQDKFQEYEWQLHHWVLLDNHYHLLGQSASGKHLVKIFKGIHGNSGSLIHEATACKTPVWWNYWDYCPRNEKQYFTRMNYLFYNPVKHGYVRSLHDYPFSNFHAEFAKIGRKALRQQFWRYPDYKTLIIDEAKGDDF